MFKSATFKLTLWYLAIAMSISIIFSVALYNVTTNELDRGLNSVRRNLYNQFPIFENEPEYGFGAHPLYINSAHRILLRLILYNILVLVVAGYASYWLAKKTLEPIEAAHIQQKRFTADVSHELRTPLTAIKMESEVALMNSKISSNDLKKTINSNLEEVGKLEGLINSLLRLTKLDSDELEHNFSLIRSKDIIDAAIVSADKTIKSHSINIETSIKNSFVKGDKESLTQLLLILLDNAIKYSPKKSTIKIESDIEDNMAVWRVVDEGQGIPPKALERVFERFYRADESRNKTNAEGYGLGLSIAKMIADIHHGNITLTSQVNKGTRAIVYLPIYSSKTNRPKTKSQGKN